MNIEKDTEKRCIAFPAEMEQRVMRICRRRKCSFSAFVQEAVVKALQERRK